jgi:hypothetical protein
MVPMFTDHHLYFGDLHNHNAVGYAKGSLERSFEIAREHLDFFAFTGHAQWHDMLTMPEGKHMKWVHGFREHERNWPRVREMTREANDPGRFATFLGYEWHSSSCGDYCVLYHHDEGELIFADSVESLAEQMRPLGAILVPHHAAYARGWRGIDWARCPTDVCPVAEVYSEHGACFDDRGLHPMILHSNGGRTTTGTIGYALSKGLRVGVIASTDDHFGYPGAYREGLAAVWATDLSREAIWEAIRARRTYAVTGDRIGLGLALNGQPMGSEVAHDSQREIAVRVEAMDEIEKVEILRNGRVVHREHVPTVLPDDPFEGGGAKVRLQWGWGPWAALEMARTADWEGEIRIEGGRLLNATACFQSGPFDETRRDRLIDVSESGLGFTSFTSRRDAFQEDATKGVILELDGQPSTHVKLRLEKPAPGVVECTLDRLMHGSVSHFSGPFTSESVLIHRLLVPRSYCLDFTWTDQSDEPQRTDYYMVRVAQANGHMAWSSPVWVEACG